MAAISDDSYSRPLRHELQEKLAQDLISADRKEVTVTGEMALENLIKVFRDENVHSVPVLDKKGEHCLGFVDYRDLVGFVCQTVPDFEKDKKSRAQFEQLVHTGTTDRALHLHKVKSLVDFSGRDPYVPLFADATSLLQVAELFGKGIYRVALFHGDDKNLVTLSQNDVARFLHEEGFRGHGKDVGAMTLEALGYGTSVVATIPASATLSSALRRLHESGFSGFAVVDADGKLVGNFSASDLQGVYAEAQPNFKQTVLEFLTSHSFASLRPYTINPTTATLAEVVAQFVETGLAHFWVQDEDGKPSGVFTLTDLCNLAVGATLEKAEA